MKKAKVLSASVVDNKDPKMMGRVKLRISSMHDGVPDEDLPWAIPQNGSSGNGSTDIPTIGESVYVEFPDGDYHEPQYKGNVINSNNLANVFKTNYPNRKGFVSQYGMTFYRDETNGDVHFSSPNGISIDFQSDGITINTTGSLTINIGGMSCVINGSGITLTGGDIIADGISLKTHVHPGVVPGASNTETPV